MDVTYRLVSSTRQLLNTIVLIDVIYIIENTLHGEGAEDILTRLHLTEPCYVNRFFKDFKNDLSYHLFVFLRMPE